MIKFFRTVLFVIAFILIFIGVYMMANGSFEMHPTSEQQEKVRIVGALFIFVGGIISFPAFIMKKK